MDLGTGRNPARAAVRPGASSILMSQLHYTS